MRTWPFLLNFIKETAQEKSNVLQAIITDFQPYTKTEIPEPKLKKSGQTKTQNSRLP